MPFLCFKTTQRELIAFLAKTPSEWVNNRTLEDATRESRQVGARWAASYYLRAAMNKRPPLVERRTEPGAAFFRVTEAGLAWLAAPKADPVPEATAGPRENALTWRDIADYVGGRTSLTELGGRYGVGPYTVRNWFRQRGIRSLGHRYTTRRLNLPSRLTQQDVDEVMAGVATLSVIGRRHGVKHDAVRRWMEELGASFVKSPEGVIVPDPRLAGVKIKPFAYTNTAALFSPCRKYRYRLRRVWEGG